MKPTRQLLAEYASLLMEIGPDSPRLRGFVAAHARDAEFVELAEVSRRLCLALQLTESWPASRTRKRGDLIVAR